MILTTKDLGKNWTSFVSHTSSGYAVWLLLRWVSSLLLIKITLNTFLSLSLLVSSIRIYFQISPPQTGTQTEVCISDNEQSRKEISASKFYTSSLDFCRYFVVLLQACFTFITFLRENTLNHDLHGNCIKNCYDTWDQACSAVAELDKKQHLDLDLLCLGITLIVLI